MDPQDIADIVSPIAVLLAALGGGWITLVSTRRADDRADRREVRRVLEVRSERQAALAGEIADLFQAEMVRFRAFDPYSDGSFDEAFSEYWWERGELAFLKLVDRVTDPAVRGRFKLVLGALSSDARKAYGDDQQDWWVRLFTLGREIAMAAVREQSLQDDIAGEVRLLEERLAQADD